jgi:thiol:disulfide interchange protein DsbD
VLGLLLTVASAGAAGPRVEAKWRSTGSDGAAELTLTVSLESGWHVNANDPDRPYLVPTTLEVTAPAGTKVDSITYPDAVVHSLAFAPDTRLRLYEGTFPIRVKLSGAPPARLDATLAYQACSDETCLPPTSLASPYEGGK